MDEETCGLQSTDLKESSTTEHAHSRLHKQIGRERVFFKKKVKGIVFGYVCRKTQECLGRDADGDEGNLERTLVLSYHLVGILDSVVGKCSPELWLSYGNDFKSASDISGSSRRAK